MQVPSDLKKLRGCLRCYLVKTEQQFKTDGCENCPFLHLDEDMDQVATRPLAQPRAAIRAVGRAGLALSPMS